MDDELVYAHVGFGPDAVDYRAGWDLQREVHARRVAGAVPDSCLLLEHAPVYTAGKRTAASDRPAGDPGAPVIDVDRGGKITWHGPGQLTAYPITKLREPVDVLVYVRALEESMIRVCAEFGLRAIRVEGRSGAWLPADPGRGLQERKVGAIGARVARGVTMHGLALNCDCDLSWFDRIVPCGIRDATVTSLTEETGIGVSVSDVTPLLERHLAAALGYRAWRRIHSTAPLTAARPMAKPALLSAPTRRATRPPPSALDVPSAPNPSALDVPSAPNPSGLDVPSAPNPARSMCHQLPKRGTNVPFSTLGRGPVCHRAHGREGAGVPSSMRAEGGRCAIECVREGVGGGIGWGRG